jgi:DNA-binding transcriptional ArsR family regulator
MAISGEGGTAGTGNPRGAGAERALSLGPQPLPELIEYRKVEDAATMKALADPLRLKILRVLGKGARVEPRVMTVKQLAEELGEPTTKLYRHIKQLLAVDMIQVAELRLVGGIVEQHYRVAQAGWAVHPAAPEVPREQLLSEELFGMADAAITEYFARYEAALRDGRTFLRGEDNLENPPHIRSVGMIGDCQIPRDRAADFAERLHKLVKEFSDIEPHTEQDGVTGNLMVMFYATQPDADA